MTKLGKLWTGAVAYVSLGVGAGLSMAGNLADTYRTRGDAVDMLDKVMAVGWPALVILAIEMFVAPRWSGKTMFQVWRWFGCLTVGGMAMVVSWTHLHDLMASRGQLAIVAILGPLAIDGMAIMATGLILSTRGQVASGHGTATEHATAEWPEDMATRLDNAVANDHSYWLEPDPVATQPLSADGRQLATEVATFLATDVPVSPAPARTPRNTKAMDEALELYRAWNPAELPVKEIDAQVVERFKVSTRTARRWRSIALGTPTSGGPVS
jgi:hypothetical protein